MSTSVQGFGEAGKASGSLDGKTAGALDKDAFGDESSQESASESSYDSAYSDSGYSDGAGYSGDSDDSGSYGGDATDSDGDSTDDSGDDSTGSGDAGTDTGDGDDDGDDQPDELYVEGESDPPGDIEVDDPVVDVPDDDVSTPDEPRPPDGTVSIDIEAMIRLVAAMERAAERITTLQHEMRTILGNVDVDTSETANFDQIAVWIEDELPGLRRRLALAQGIEADTSTPRPAGPHSPVVRIPYVGDENLVANHPPRQSYDNGADAAERFAIPREQKPLTREIIADLRSGRHDPYFAKEFVHKTDPETVVRVVLQATGGGGGETPDHSELVELTASTVATGSRGTGELAPPDDYEQQWAALRASDDPATAAMAARLRPPPEQP